jgi:hypothetical protein
MQKTMEHAKTNRVSPAALELLIHERNKGKSLRQLGQMFGMSHEWVRQVLAKHGQSRVELLAENTVAARLGCPVGWLIKIRKEGIINPTRPGGRWFYSEEQVRQIPLIIAEMRKCELCDEIRPPGYHKFCRECSQYRKKHYYRSLRPEKKAEHRNKSVAEGKSREMERNIV